MMIANRTRELEFFKRMIQRDIPYRVLLIEAESGFGKTCLLALFKHTLPGETLSVVIDLRSSQIGTPYIFSSVSAQLGEKHFPHLDAAVKRDTRGGVEISDTKMIGQDQHFSVVLPNVDEYTRTLRLIELQKAFFRDLKAIHQKVVFLFDSYEKAPTELALWLEGEFLTELAHMDQRQPIVVIAGQQIPKPTANWMHLHHCYRLEGIQDQDAWYDYIQYKQFPLNRDHIWAVMNVLNGHPDNIEKALAALAGEKQ